MESVNDRNDCGRADTHVHTKYSGFSKYSLAEFPESISEPGMVVKAALRRGLDVLCITDHNSIAGALKARQYAVGKEIEVIVGEEVSTAEGEVIGLFLQERIDPGLGAEETAKRIHEQGGIAIAPHPFSPHCSCLGHRAQHLDLDGVEVFNAIHRDPYSNKLASRNFIGNGKAITGGSDAHSIEMVGNAYTTFPGISADDLRASIRHKSTYFGGEITSLAACVRWSQGAAMEIGKAAYKSLRGQIHHEDVLQARVDRIKKRNKIIAIVASSMFLMPPIPQISGEIGERITRKKAKRIWDENRFPREQSIAGDMSTASENH